MVRVPDPMWIDTPPGVREVASVCRRAGRIALDTEADSLHSYFHKVCLVQVTAAGRDFLVDPLALEADALQPLWEILADPSVAVVMHGADYDLRVLDRDYSAAISGLHDTQIMAQLLGEPRTGLAVLLEREFAVEVDKRHQRADWARRPLASALREYAAADSAYLEELEALFRNRLEQLERWQWAEEEFRALEGVRHTPADDNPLAFEKLKGGRACTGAARDRLYTLFEWRDQRARDLDVPPFRVLGNQPLVALAQKPPRDLEAMSTVPGLGPRFTRRWGRGVLAQLRRPRPAPPPRKRRRTSGPGAEVRTRITALSRVRDTVADDLGLQPGLVCPRAVVEAVASGDGSDGLAGTGLKGWRLDLLREPFLQALAGEDATAEES